MLRSTDVPAVLGAAFALGAIVGSFANVCIYRMPRKRRLQEELKLAETDVLPDDHSIAKPRSFCPACRTPIAWWDNLPILSYALLNGRCRACRARIPFRYPLVEALTGAVFALLAWRHLGDPVRYPPAVTAVLAAFAVCLIITTFIDIDYRIIPYPLSLGITALAIPLCVLLPGLQTQIWPPWGSAPPASRLEAGFASLAGIVAGAGLIDLMGLVGMGYLWVKQTLKASSFGPALGRSGLTRWLVTGPSDPLKDVVVGGGDLNLMTAVGGLLGWKAALLVTLFLAPLVGSLVGVVYLMSTKDHYIAYGPFLALGTLVCMLFGPDMIGFAEAAFRDPPILMLR